MIRAAALAGAARKVALGLALLGASSGSMGCTPACDTGEGDAPQKFTDGKTVSGVYQTSDWEGSWLHFPGGKRYDLEHHLGFKPASIDISLSFSESGVGSSVQGDTAAKAAGNSAEIELVNDQLIRIKNDTCAEFWVRVVAQSDMRGPDAGTDGAGE